MNKTNKLLYFITFVLGFLVVCFCGYIVYDKMLEKDVDEDNAEILLTEVEAREILKELDYKYYPFYSGLGPYCGKTNNDDYISFGSYETNDFRDYVASLDFNSISQLKKYLETIMIDELVPKYFDNGISYIEKDGKLYCQLSHKGGGITRNYDVDSEYKIVELTDSSVVADIVFCGRDMGELLCSDKNVKITIVKDLNGNWVVSNYYLIYS